SSAKCIIDIPIYNICNPQRTRNNILPILHGGLAGLTVSFASTGLRKDFILYCLFVTTIEASRAIAV
ncbi:MAG: hypothetical protein ACI90V_003476, partial [Bacillariaceae sp.]